MTTITYAASPVTSLPETATDPTGAEQNLYDTQHGLPDGHRRCREHHHYRVRLEGNLIKAETQGVTSTFDYDSQTNDLKFATRNGVTTTFDYDTSGQVTETTDDRGNEAL